MMQSDLRGRRVLAIAAYDSFLRSATFFGQHLAARGASVDYEIVKAGRSQLSAAQRRAAGLERPVDVRPLEAIAQRTVLDRYDVVLLALDGARMRRFMLRLASAYPQGSEGKRPITVAFYPGLLFRYHFEGMFSRSSTDLFLLNSPHDLSLYRDMQRALGVSSDNGMLGGLSVVPPRVTRPIPERGRVLFVGQPTVPVWRHERLYVLDRLIALAKRHPDVEVAIKPRHRPGETTLHKENHHFELLLRELGRERELPPNLVVRYEPVSELLATARLCVTFSSTAAFEALALGVPTRIITDLGVHEHFGNHFFLGSDLMCQLDELRADLPYMVDESWFRAHVTAASDHLHVFDERLDQLLDERARARDFCMQSARLFGRARGYESFIRQRFDAHHLTLVAETRTKVARDGLRRMGARLLALFGA